MHTSKAPGRSYLNFLSLPAVAAITLSLILGFSNYHLAQRASALERELSETRSSLKNELVTLQKEASARQSEYHRQIHALRQIVEENNIRTDKAVTDASRASTAAKRYSDDLGARIRSQAVALQEQHKTFSAQLGEMQNNAASTEERVNGIATAIHTVSGDVKTTRKEIGKTLGELHSMRGDLGVQSGLIATNAKELAALRALGDRDYIEFDLTKTKAPQRVGDITILLRKSDEKRNRFTIELVTNDKKVEKKDRNINEPVQFYLARARVPYEIVVNEVRKDRIIGYLAAPKLRAAR